MMNSMNILLVEDDESIADQITTKFASIGHDVRAFSQGIQALNSINEVEYDIIILDLMLPDVDGMEILTTLRISKIKVPVIVLSALYSIEKKVTALRSGANDYLVKPFSFDELFARIDILVNRNKQSLSELTQLKVGELTLDLVTRQAKREGKTITLLPKEFKFLELLMRHQGKCLTRAMLFEKVWNYNFDPQTNVIDVHMCRLRNKIDKGFSYEMLLTDKGNGYILKARGEHSPKTLTQNLV